MSKSDDWDGVTDRRKVSHFCMQEENIGAFKEFMETSKTAKNSIRSLWIAFVGIIFTLLLEIGGGLYLWGVQTQIVKQDHEYVWGDLTKTSKETSRNVDRVLAKLETIQIVSIVGSRGQELESLKGNR